jgi:hypothetical protein
VKNTGKIIVLAFPDTFVTHSNELICRFLPLIGLGTRAYIKAGHAALVLVDNETGNMQYFDFGRYVTPDGFGRVRGAVTDAELEIPFRASFANDASLSNLGEILVWLDAHPQKTHGKGRLLASVCDFIEYEKALNYVQNLMERGSIRYGAFEKSSSNCARFVTDTILAATAEKRIIKALNFNKKFTPSTVGNVEKAALYNDVYQVSEGEVELFKGTAFKENLINYFSRKKGNELILGLNFMSAIPPAAQKLSGIGSNAWFELTSEVGLPRHHFRIRRYNDLGKIDFDGVYASEAFNGSQPFRFTYDSHCDFCHVLQDSIKIKLTKIATFASFSLSRKMHSA